MSNGDGKSASEATYTTTVGTQVVTLPVSWKISKIELRSIAAKEKPKDAPKPLADPVKPPASAPSQPPAAVDPPLDPAAVYSLKVDEISGRSRVGLLRVAPTPREIEEIDARETGKKNADRKYWTYYTTRAGDRLEDLADPVRGEKRGTLDRAWRSLVERRQQMETDLAKLWQTARALEVDRAGRKKLEYFRIQCVTPALWDIMDDLALEAEVEDPGEAHTAPAWRLRFRLKPAPGKALRRDDVPLLAGARMRGAFDLGKLLEHGGAGIALGREAAGAGGQGTLRLTPCEAYKLLPREKDGAKVLSGTVDEDEGLPGRTVNTRAEQGLDAWVMVPWMARVESKATIRITWADVRGQRDSKRDVDQTIESEDRGGGKREDVIRELVAAEAKQTDAGFLQAWRSRKLVPDPKGGSPVEAVRASCELLESEEAGGRRVVDTKVTTEDLLQKSRQEVRTREARTDKTEEIGSGPTASQRQTEIVERLLTLVSTDTATGKETRREVESLKVTTESELGKDQYGGFSIVKRRKRTTERRTSSSGPAGVPTGADPVVDEVEETFQKGVRIEWRGTEPVDATSGDPDHRRYDVVERRLKGPGAPSERRYVLTRALDETHYRYAESTPALDPFTPIGNDLFDRYHENWYPVGLRGRTFPAFELVGYDVSMKVLNSAGDEIGTFEPKTKDLGVLAGAGDDGRAARARMVGGLTELALDTVGLKSGVRRAWKGFGAAVLEATALAPRRVLRNGAALDVWHPARPTIEVVEKGNSETLPRDDGTLYILHRKLAAPADAEVPEVADELGLAYAQNRLKVGQGEKIEPVTVRVSVVQESRSFSPVLFRGVVKDKTAWSAKRDEWRKEEAEKRAKLEAALKKETDAWEADVKKGATGGTERADALGHLLKRPLLARDLFLANYDTLRKPLEAALRRSAGELKRLSGEADKVAEEVDRSDKAIDAAKGVEAIRKAVATREETIQRWKAARERCQDARNAIARPLENLDFLSAGMKLRVPKTLDDRSVPYAVSPTVRVVLRPLPDNKAGLKKADLPYCLVLAGFLRGVSDEKAADPAFEKSPVGIIDDPLSRIGWGLRFFWPDDPSWTFFGAARGGGGGGDGKSGTGPGTDLAGCAVWQGEITVTDNNRHPETAKEMLRALEALEGKEPAEPPPDGKPPEDPVDVILKALDEAAKPPAAEKGRKEYTIRQEDGTLKRLVAPALPCSPYRAHFLEVLANCYDRRLLNVPVRGEKDTKLMKILYRPMVISLAGEGVKEVEVAPGVRRRETDAGYDMYAVFLRNMVYIHWRIDERNIYWTWLWYKDDAQKSEYASQFYDAEYDTSTPDLLARFWDRTYLRYFQSMVERVERHDEKDNKDPDPTSSPINAALRQRVAGPDGLCLRLLPAEIAKAAGLFGTAEAGQGAPGLFVNDLKAWEADKEERKKLAKAFEEHLKKEAERKEADDEAKVVLNAIARDWMATMVFTLLKLALFFLKKTGAGSKIHPNFFDPNNALWRSALNFMGVWWPGFGYGINQTATPPGEAAVKIDKELKHAKNVFPALLGAAVDTDDAEERREKTPELKNMAARKEAYKAAERELGDAAKDLRNQTAKASSALERAEPRRKRVEERKKEVYPEGDPRINDRDREIETHEKEIGRLERKAGEAAEKAEKAQERLSAAEEKKEETSARKKETQLVLTGGFDYDELLDLMKVYMTVGLECKVEWKLFWILWIFKLTLTLSASVKGLITFGWQWRPGDYVIGDPARGRFGFLEKQIIQNETNLATLAIVRSQAKKTGAGKLLAGWLGDPKSGAEARGDVPFPANALAWWQYVSIGMTDREKPKKLLFINNDGKQWDARLDASIRAVLKGQYPDMALFETEAERSKRIQRKAAVLARMDPGDDGPIEEPPKVYESYDRVEDLIKGLEQFLDQKNPLRYVLVKHGQLDAALGVVTREKWVGPDPKDPPNFVCYVVSETKDRYGKLAHLAPTDNPTGLIGPHVLDASEMIAQGSIAFTPGAELKVSPITDFSFLSEAEKAKLGALKDVAKILDFLEVSAAGAITLPLIFSIDMGGSERGKCSVSFGVNCQLTFKALGFEFPFTVFDWRLFVYHTNIIHGRPTYFVWNEGDTLIFGNRDNSWEKKEEIVPS